MDESFLEAACDLDGMLDCGGRMITISISDSAQSSMVQTSQYKPDRYDMTQQTFFDNYSYTV